MAERVMSTIILLSWIMLLFAVPSTIIVNTIPSLSNITKIFIYTFPAILGFFMLVWQCYNIWFREKKN